MPNTIIDLKTVDAVRDIKRSNGSRIKSMLLSVNPRYMTAGIPDDINPRREAPIDKKLYRQVKASLLNGSDTFIDDLFGERCHGITIIADRITKRKNGVYRISVGKDQGIGDGLHVYKIILDCKSELMKNPGNKNLVTVRVVTGLVKEEAIDLVSALSATMQVKDTSLFELRGGFSELKKILRPQGLEDKFFYNEVKQPGKRSILGLVRKLGMCSPGMWPTEGTNVPLQTYSSGDKRTLNSFENNTESYLAMAPIAKEILYLHEYIKATLVPFYNQACNGQGGKFAFVKVLLKDEVLPFSGMKTKYELSKAVTLPMLSGFRYLVEDNGSHFVLKEDLEVLKVVWELAAPKVMLIAKEQVNTSRMSGEPVEEYKKRVKASTNELLGKNRNFWRMCANEIQMAYTSLH